MRGAFNAATSTVLARCVGSSARQVATCLVRCPCRLRDRWRHGCCHRSRRDEFTACSARRWRGALDAACVLQGPCPPTIAGHAASTSLYAPWRHPCRQGSCDGERARTSRDGRCAVSQQSSWQLSGLVCSLFKNHQRTIWCGVLADCGTVGGMDAAIEPPWTGSRRVLRAVRAPRPRLLAFCCRALARPPSQDTLQVRPCKLRGGIHAAKGPATVSGQGPVEMVGAQSLNRAVGNCPTRVCSLFNTPPANYLVRCPRRLRDRWRHGCRHRAPMDGFTACPASGEGTAHSSLQVCGGALASQPSRDTL